MSAPPFQFRDSYFPALERRRAVMPAEAEALNREGRRLRERGEISAAIAKHQAALTLKSDAAATHQNLALAWWRRGNLPEALGAYRRVMELRPNSPAAHSDYIYALYHDPASTGETLLAESRRWAGKFAISCQLPVVSCQWDVGRSQEPEARSQKELIHSLNPEPPRPELVEGRTLNPPRRRLRIGYVSADFRRHTLRHFISPLLKHHDRSVVEVFCYSNVGEPDRVTELLRPLAEQWREVRKLKDEQLASLIREDRIDILVDLSGHMGGNRLAMFARKPAPVQVQMYFAGTSGLGEMDNRITDAYSEPGAPGFFTAEDAEERREFKDKQFDPMSNCAPQSSSSSASLRDLCGEQNFCTEKLVRLSGCAWPYEPEEDTPRVGELPAIGNGYITFGSMNRPIKISERMIGVWSRILQAVPGSKLMFLADAVASDVEYHYQRFARHGIGPDRLTPLARTPRRKYLECVNCIDFCLDTYPYAGDTTTCDGLWMGVPTVTLAGESFHARRGVSHLSNVGLEQWIAGSEEEYVGKAIAFARDVAALAHLRGELRERMRQSPLLDFAGYARKLEEAYRCMHRRHAVRIQAFGLMHFRQTPTLTLPRSTGRGD